MCTPMLYISELCEDWCRREWNWQANWQSVNHIPGIHDNGTRDHGYVTSDFNSGIVMLPMEFTLDILAGELINLENEMNKL